MKNFLLAILILLAVGCANGRGGPNPDSSNVITDSNALMNRDTTSVLGANPSLPGEADRTGR